MEDLSYIKSQFLKFLEETSIKQQIQELKSLNIKITSIDQLLLNIKSLINILIKIVKVVEYFDIEVYRKTKTVLSSNTKLELAFILATSLLNFSWFMSMISSPILKVIISTIVQLLNEFNTGWTLNVSLEKEPEKILEKNYIQDI